jgi:retron-type reverse transcriptase
LGLITVCVLRYIAITTVEGQPIHPIVEVDIKGFFDNVDQDQLMAFLGHRIADKRTPQGGVMEVF